MFLQQMTAEKFRTFMRWLTALLLSLFLVYPAGAASLKNQLLNHASPYLAMHGHDPVHWQEWNAATLARARQENKMIYVSSGYFSCHWCHVMQRESYRDPVIAKLLNDNFIPVKVDRELNSALDARLIEYVENTQGFSGWPLNVFITPEGYPLVGMVYVPPKNFLKIVTNLKHEWQNNQKELKQLAINVSSEVSGVQDIQSTPITAALVKQSESALLQKAFSMADEMQGGFGETSKFPSAPQLKILLKVYQHSRDDRLYRFLVLTFDQMASQGLRDHLGGGFFRYVVDPNWQIPHFEKMLYDNALLAALYLQAAKVLKHPQYRVVASETLDFMQSQMRLASGGLLTSLSAIDAKGVEGGYYLWDTDEIKKILSKKEWSLVKVYWGLQGAPELEHGHHLVEANSVTQLVRETGWSKQDIIGQLQSAKKKLLKRRQGRGLPEDRKALAAWNGLALSAYIAGAREGLIDMTQVRQLKDYIATNLWDGKTLYRMTSSAKYSVPGDLEDYAYVSQALLAWAIWQGDDQDWQRVQTLVEQAWHKFYSKQGWKRSETSLLKYHEAQTLISDGPMPSPAAVLIKTSLALAHYRHDKALQVQAKAALSLEHEQLVENIYWYASYMDALYTQQQFADLK